MTILKDIGEHKLLEIIDQYCDQTINGDDGAIIDVSKGKKLVVTTDVLVEDVHFSDRSTPPDSIGYRAVTANLSDLAAMGSFPIGITVGLSLRENVQLSWVEELYQGMQKSLEPYGVSILGGDITRSKVNTIAITALGEVEAQHIIYRHTAKVGNSILVTGNHGLSRAGLELLLYPDKYSHISSEIREKLIYRHQYPKPRLDVIKKLYEDYNSKVFIAGGCQSLISGMDSSDGLADAIIQICQQSKVGAKINLSEIKIAPEITAITKPEKALDWVLYGGEDFELVLFLPRTLAQYLMELLPGDCQLIGEVTAEQNIEIIEKEKEKNGFKFLLNQKKTFQHF